MPKRKSDKSDYEKLLKKFKKLEKKVRRRCRDRSRSSSLDEQLPLDCNSEETTICDNEARNIVEPNVAELLDGKGASESEGLIDRDTEIASERVMEKIPEPSTASTAPDVDTPSTSAPHTDDIVQASSSAEPDPTEVALDSTILGILGDDPTIQNNFGPDIHKDLAIRLEHIATHGLTKNIRKELIDKYLLPGNCKLINAPALNAEIKAATSELNAKRDKNIEIRQKQTASAISSLGRAINILISKNNADSELITLLMDTGRILCDSQHNDSIIRRNFLLSSMKKDMKDQLQDTKPDVMLFGQNLLERIKTAKAINKSGAELKALMPKGQVNSKKSATGTSSPKHLNWRGPYPTRKPPNPPKTRETLQTKNQPSTSSRLSQRQPMRGRR